MAEGNVKVRVAFLGLPKQIQINIDPNIQLKQFKEELSKQTLIHPSEMKILKNNQMIQSGDEQTIKEVGFKDGEIIFLLTKSSKSAGSYAKERQQNIFERLKTTNFSKHHYHYLFQKGLKPEEKKSKAIQQINGFITKDHLDVLVKYLFPKAIWKGKEESFLKKDGLIMHVLERLLTKQAYYLYLAKILESRVIRFIIFDGQNIKEEDHDVTQTYDKGLYEKLKKMNFPQNKIINALHITCNNYNEALKLLLSGDLYRDAFSVECDENDEEKFIYGWLSNPKHKFLTIRLAMDPKEIELYLNSLKLKCTRLYDMFRKRRIFISKVVMRQAAIWLSK